MLVFICTVYSSVWLVNEYCCPLLQQISNSCSKSHSLHSKCAQNMGKCVLWIPRHEQRYKEQLMSDKDLC